MQKHKNQDLFQKGLAQQTLCTHVTTFEKGGLFLQGIPHLPQYF